VISDTEEETHRVDPSHIAAFTPPRWKLLAVNKPAPPANDDPQSGIALFGGSATKNWV
jgi:hypothetical protein